MIKRVAYFFKEKAMVHVLCKDKRFYNGSIIEVSEPEFFIINDRLNGATPIFFIELKRVERFREEWTSMLDTALNVGD